MTILQCSGPSMEPTIVSDDIVFSERMSRHCYKIKKYDKLLNFHNLYAGSERIRIDVALLCFITAVLFKIKKAWIILMFYFLFFQG